MNRTKSAEKGSSINHIIRSLAADQGDQMSLLKNRPKFNPKLIRKFCTVGKSSPRIHTYVQLLKFFKNCQMKATA
jgi:hypothetical protein